VAAQGQSCIKDCDVFLYSDVLAEDSIQAADNGTFNKSSNVEYNTLVPSGTIRNRFSFEVYTNLLPLFFACCPLRAPSIVLMCVSKECLMKTTAHATN